MTFSADVSAALRAEAIRCGLDPDALHVVAEVESGGVAFVEIDGRRRPAILFEYHVFDRNLPPKLRAEARRRGLAAPRWGDIPYPSSMRSRYEQLEAAKKICEEAAHMACSWGIGQVLGENAEWLGYTSAKALAAEAMSGVTGQIRLMVRFITKRGLIDELQRRDWRGFARLYNGPGQVDRYAALMVAAHRRIAINPEETESTTARAGLPVLRVGSRGEDVARLQRSLRAIGRHLVVDGDFGPATRAAVIAFQTQEQLLPDGAVGPVTWARIEAHSGIEDRPEFLMAG